MPTHSLYLTTDIPTTTPAIPNISCVGADTSIEMTFSANSDGGSPITSYQYSIDNFINTIDINSSPYTIENLTDGNTYNVELRAVNKNGFGEYTSGILPTTSLPENFQNLRILGDVNEPLLEAAINQIIASGKMLPQVPKVINRDFIDAKSITALGSEMYVELKN
jgi:hypothetical protein